MDDSDGQRLAAAYTLWTYLNIETGKPSHIPESVKEAYGNDEKIDNVAALMDAYIAYKENREAFD